MSKSSASFVSFAFEFTSESELLVSLSEYLLPVDVAPHDVKKKIKKENSIECAKNFDFITFFPFKCYNI